MLYIVGTPLGNLEDLSPRALRILKEADAIAAEDTRRTLRLLNHFEIKNRLISYHEHNKDTAGQRLLELLLDGKNIALVTDAGMPCISDPGQELVRLCRENFVAVTSIPGATALATALALSGIVNSRFIFEGFLPADKKRRTAIIDGLKEETRTVIIYEAPHRLVDTLAQLGNAIGSRNISVARELTKLHEEVIYGSVHDMLEHFTQSEPLGEFVIVIEGKSETELLSEQRASWADMDIAEHLSIYIAEGLDKKDAMKRVAKDRGVSKSDIYKRLLE